MRSNKKSRRPRRTIYVLVTIVTLAGASAAFFLHRPNEPAQREAPPSAVRIDIQADLARCDVYRSEQTKKSCVDFVRRWCPALKANHAQQEKPELLAQEPGRRLPALRQELDPFFPVDCYQQWWLTEGAFAFPQPEIDSAGAHGHATQAGENIVIKSLTGYAGFSELSPLYFAHRDAAGTLQPPEKYEIVTRYSRHDQELLHKALQAAYRYADVNAAIRDGYAPQSFFSGNMGIHFSNLSLFDETLDLQRPEFLTYIKSKTNNAYALAQIGYIVAKDNHFKKFSPRAFETPEAEGHHHYMTCVFVDEKGWWKTGLMTNNEPTQEKIRVFVGAGDGEVSMTSTDAIALYTDMKANRFKNPYRVGCFDSVWMMHVAVNLYNEDGLFADSFPLINTMSTTGELYSLFGRKFDPNDYLRPDGR